MHTFNTKTSLAYHFRLVIDFSFLFLDSTSFINCVCEREESDQPALSDLSLHFTHAIRHIFCMTHISYSCNSNLELAWKAWFTGKDVNTLPIDLLLAVFIVGSCSEFVHV